MKQIELQLKNLLKQAEEASRYKTISNDIKKSEALLSYLKIQEINKTLEGGYKPWMPTKAPKQQLVMQFCIPV